MPRSKALRARALASGVASSACVGIATKESSRRSVIMIFTTHRTTSKKASIGPKDLATSFPASQPSFPAGARIRSKNRGGLVGAPPFYRGAALAHLGRHARFPPERRAKGGGLGAVRHRDY